jgi:hypothetical protein
MKVAEFTVEKIIDPIGVIEGDRYEFKLYIEVDEDDDLFTEGGVGLRLIFAVNGDEGRIATYNFFERNNEASLDFEMEEEEEQFVLQFCKENTGMNIGLDGE